MERSAINPAPDVTGGDYSSGSEDDGTMPSPGGEIDELESPPDKVTIFIHLVSLRWSY